MCDGGQESFHNHVIGLPGDAYTCSEVEFPILGKIEIDRGNELRALLIDGVPLPLAFGKGESQPCPRLKRFNVRLTDDSVYSDAIRTQSGSYEQCCRKQSADRYPEAHAWALGSDSLRRDRHSACGTDV